MLPLLPLISAWAATIAKPYPLADPAGTNTAVSVTTLLSLKLCGIVCEITEPLVTVIMPWAVVAGYIFMPVGIIATSAVNVLSGKRTAGTRIVSHVTGCWYGVRAQKATRAERAITDRKMGRSGGRVAFSLTTYKWIVSGCSSTVCITCSYCCGLNCVPSFRYTIF